MPTLVKGPWKTPAEAPEQPSGPSRTEAIVRAVLATVAVLAVAYLAFAGLRSIIAPDPSVDPAITYDRHSESHAAGRWFVGEDIDPGVWQTTVPEGATCSYARTNTGGFKDESSGTHGTLTTTLSSRSLYVDFDGPCTWVRVK